MDKRAAEMVAGFLESTNGDLERTARFMRDALRIGGIRQCRALVLEACEVLGIEKPDTTAAGFHPSATCRACGAVVIVRKTKGVRASLARAFALADHTIVAHGKAVRS